MKKILVLGSNSFTGHHLCERLSDEYHILKTTRTGISADLKFDAVNDNIEVLAQFLKRENPDVVINCISNGNVDSCEENPELSKQINFEFVKELCILQQKHNFHLLHFSSNAIYDGDNYPYAESDAAMPINVYGEIKYLADKFIEQNLSKYTILRPITMFGLRLQEQRHNPFSFFYMQLLENKDIVAVNDVYVNMLNIEDLVKCTDSAIRKEVFGTFNISGDDIVNRYEFVSLIKKFLPNSTSNIKSVSSENFKTLAKRPKNTSFSNDLMKSNLNVYPASLEQTIQTLVSSLETTG